MVHTLPSPNCSAEFIASETKQVYRRAKKGA
jgi:hypothetical protein